MKFKRGNRIIIFIMIILINLAMRFPVIPNEVGTDSYYIHTISDVITTFGEVRFISHPLQFLGFSSQPPSVPILISGLSQTTGLSSEYAILLLSLVITILGIFTYYTLIYNVTKNEFQSFFATLIFTTAPEFLRITLWTVTTRALFMALFPLFLYLLLKLLNKNKRLVSILLFLLLLLMLLSTHHLGILLLLVLFAFTVTFILTENNFEIIINNKKLPDFITWTSVYIVMMSLIIFRVGFIKDHINLWGIYTKGIFFNGESPDVIFFNMIFDYISKINILIFLAPIGIFALFNLKEKRSIFENYALIVIILTAPIMGVGVYAPMFLSIVLTYLISTSIITLFKINIMKKMSMPLLTLFIVISLCFSSFMMFHWGYKTIENDADKYMPETKNTAMFLQNHGGNGSFTSNERGGSIYKYSAYSGMRGAPGPKYEETGRVKPKLNIDSNELMGGGVESLIVFESENSTKNQTDIWYQFPKLWAGNVDDGADIINNYNIRYVLETQFGDYSVDYVKKMELFNDIHESKSEIYDNNKEKIYFLQ